MPGVGVDFYVAVLKALGRIHGDRLMSQEFYNFAVEAMSGVEDAYKACEPTPGAEPEQDGDDEAEGDEP